MTPAAILTWLALGHSPIAQQDTMAAPNNFARFETHILSNGLKVWYKRLPDYPKVSISVAVPVGSDHDPPGREQLAHFLEHVQFGDHMGKTEVEIKREIDERGGVRNAFTASDRTFYYVRIGKEHGLFALEWLYRILSPHEITAETVERQRQPVAIEVRARPRQFFDWVTAIYLDPPLLRVPDFWQREFGIETRRSRDYYPYRSLQRITADDLRRFYDRYYVPSLMTLTVIGDLERDTVLATIERTFGTLERRPAPEVTFPLRDPGRRRDTYFWEFRSNVLYDSRFKFYDMTSDQYVKLNFLADFLGKRLRERLRYGERKAVYSIATAVRLRGTAGYFHILSGIKPEELDYARDVIEEELAAIRQGTLPEDEFETDRAAVAAALRVQHATAEDLERWVAHGLYLPQRQRDFPDLASAYETLSYQDLQSFAARNLVPEHQVLTILFPAPLSQGALVVVAGVLLWIVYALIRRRLLVPADMTRIRYVARFKMSAPYRLVVWTFFWTALAVLLRLLVHAFVVVSDRFVVGIESVTVQWSVYAVMGMSVVAFALAAFASVPRKLLIFDDHLRIKYLAYRSTVLQPANIEEISLGRFRDVWLSRRLFRCVPLALGILSPAILIRLKNGRSYFFNVRDRVEALALLERFKKEARQRSTTAPAGVGP